MERTPLPAATAIARSARPVLHAASLRRVSPICCRSSTTTWSSRRSAAISAIAYYNKVVIYGLLFDIAGETQRTIAASPWHLGARIGATFVLHT
ncbi:hypothetical protein R69749_07225 [Paraburkholderia domus]|uniref:Uncharacterized protein n=1 Tax=Paraburkholderia domus TaxID=2793075 RepID=A0A9N8N8V3_9BURK|nr:hypothetical protein R70006_07222 [Paraburkholderia domus]CAE6884220.1 hypothetical protein R69749_07225 [Paraburkholderia domus]CAE6960038.1 hypothetical protein R70199_07249 [Paraburkholderia domus]CAE6964978.1 hypothetical protein R70211_07267 [Paraburkholderia domus]